MSLRVDLNLIAPRLRRCARALVGAHPGPNEAADALVAAALRQVFAECGALAAADLETAAYATLFELNRAEARAAELGAPSQGARRAWIKAGGGRSGAPPETLPQFAASSDALPGALLALKLEEREALLLVALEGFSYARAARILKVSRSILLARLGRARERLPTRPPAEAAPRRPKALPLHLRLVK